MADNQGFRFIRQINGSEWVIESDSRLPNDIPNIPIPQTNIITVSPREVLNPQPNILEESFMSTVMVPEQIELNHDGEDQAYTNVANQPNDQNIRQSNEGNEPNAQIRRSSTPEQIRYVRIYDQIPQNNYIPSPPVINNVYSNIKEPNYVENFSGESEDEIKVAIKLKQLFYALNEYFKTRNFTEEQKSIILKEKLVGHARSVIVTAKPKDYTELKDALSEHFLRLQADSDKLEGDLKKYKMKPKETFRQFTERFLEAAEVVAEKFGCTFNEVRLFRIISDVILDQVDEKLHNITPVYEARNKRDIKTLIKILTSRIELDNKLLVKKDSQGAKPKKINAVENNKPKEPNVEMKVDNVQHDSSNGANAKNGIQCYLCGNFGHFQYNCPSRNTMSFNNQAHGNVQNNEYAQNNGNVSGGEIIINGRKCTPDEAKHILGMIDNPTNNNQFFRSSQGSPNDAPFPRSYVTSRPQVFRPYYRSGYVPNAFQPRTYFRNQQPRFYNRPPRFYNGQSSYYNGQQEYYYGQPRPNI